MHHLSQIFSIKTQLLEWKDVTYILVEKEKLMAGKKIPDSAAQENCFIYSDSNPNIATLCWSKAIHIN